MQGNFKRSSKSLLIEKDEESEEDVSENDVDQVINDNESLEQPASQKDAEVADDEDDVSIVYEAAIEDDDDEELVYDDARGKAVGKGEGSGEDDGEDSEIEFDEEISEEELSPTDTEESLKDLDEMDPNALFEAIDKARKVTDENPPDYLQLAESEMRGSGKVEIDDMAMLVNLLTDPSVKLLNYGKSFTINDQLKPALYKIQAKKKTDDDSDDGLRQSKSMVLPAIQRYASRMTSN